MSPATIIALATVSGAGHGQGHDVQPPEALKDVAFMLGNWKGKQNFNTGGPALVMEATDHVAPAIGGRYIEESLSTMRLGGVATDTRHLLTYTPKDGKYHAWWFNDSSAGPMELEGSIIEGKLVLVSNPTETGPGPANIFRATYETTPEKHLAWTLELKTGDTWRKLFRAEYTK